MTGLSSFWSIISPQRAHRSCWSQWRTLHTPPGSRVRPMGGRRTDQRIGLDALGEQINAVLSAGSDTRTPVAPVAPFADDPQGYWLAEERAASGPSCRKAPFAQPVCPFPPTRPVGPPFPREGSALRPSGRRFHRPDCATPPSPTSLADVALSALPQQCGFAGAKVWVRKSRTYCRQPAQSAPMPSAKSS
jgi:hypothetical protein